MVAPEPASAYHEDMDASAGALLDQLAAEIRTANENRITGPGYYPRRPGKPPMTTYTLPSAPGYLSLYNAAGQQIGGLLWRGSGTYTYFKPRSEYLDQLVAKWTCGGVVVTCPSGGRTPALGFTLRLVHPLPSRMSSTPLRWKFVPDVG